MAGQQFLGVDSVLKAYEAMGMDVWAVCQGKAVNMVGEDAAQLRHYLEMVQPNGSAYLYMLKVYNIESPDDVNEKTPCSRSFNFKLNEAATRSLSGSGQYQSVTNPLEGSILGKVSARLAAKLEKKIDKMIDGELDGTSDDDDEPKDLVSTITGIFNDPIKMQGALQLLGAVKQIFSGGAPAFSPVPAPALLSGIDPATERQQLTDRLATALDKLEKYDPQMVEHLEKLAKLAETNPMVYRGAISQLEGFVK